MMFKLTSKSVKFIVIFVSIDFVFVTNIAIAEIYKWRDQSGVIKYSDSLPAHVLNPANAKKLHQDTINSLQAIQEEKYCNDLLGNQKINQTRTFSANFFGFVANKGAAWNQKPAAVTLVSSIVAGNKSLAKISPGVSKPMQYLPLSPTGFLNVGSKTVTVFGKPILIAKAPIKPTPAQLPTPIPIQAGTGNVFYIAPNGDNNNFGSEEIGRAHV